jgi:hypothetical protein
MQQIADYSCACYGYERAAFRRRSPRYVWLCQGITALDPKNTGGHSRALAVTVDASMRRLTPDEQARYRELAVFS